MRSTRFSWPYALNPQPISNMTHANTAAIPSEIPAHCDIQRPEQISPFRQRAISTNAVASARIAKIATAIEISSLMAQILSEREDGGKHHCPHRHNERDSLGDGKHAEKEPQMHTDEHRCSQRAFFFVCVHRCASVAESSSARSIIPQVLSVTTGLLSARLGGLSISVIPVFSGKLLFPKEDSQDRICRNFRPDKMVGSSLPMRRTARKMHNPPSGVMGRAARLWCDRFLRFLVVYP